MDAWLMLLGLETLGVRMDAHVRNTARSSAFLRTRDEVSWVKAPQLGSIFTFGLRGGREAGRRFIDALELWSHLANVGDTKSLVIHPASTTHSQLSDDEMRSRRRRARGRATVGRAGRRERSHLGSRATRCAASEAA